MTDTAIRPEAAPRYDNTSSRATRILGLAALVGVVALVIFAFGLTKEDDRMRDAVRLLYIHVPIATTTYIAFGVNAVGSGMYLWKRSRWWDTVAYAGAEIGVVFCALTLVTGSIWGRPTWNTWWEWGDVKLVTTLVLFLMFVGYLAFRKVPADPDVRARRAAVIGLISAINLPIVNRSVEWWENNTLHQKSSLTDGNLENLTLFTWFLGTVVVGLIFTWLMVHRFRVAWLEEEIERTGLGSALDQRRAEAEGLGGAWDVDGGSMGESGDTP